MAGSIEKVLESYVTEFLREDPASDMLSILLAYCAWLKFAYCAWLK